AVLVHEGAGWDDHASGVAACTEVERPPDDADDAQRRSRAAGIEGRRADLLVDVLLRERLELQPVADPHMRPLREAGSDDELVGAARAPPLHEDRSVHSVTPARVDG